MDETTNIAHSIYSNPGVYELLLGSGVSRSAGIPTGWKVTNDLIKRLATMEGQPETEDLEAWYRTNFSEEPGYSADWAGYQKRHQSVVPYYKVFSSLLKMKKKMD